MDLAASRTPGRTNFFSNAGPIDTLPLFVRAGSIVPLGVPVKSTHRAQAFAKVCIYSGADSSLTLFSDDGTTYANENCAVSISHPHWNDAAGKFTHDGTALWTGPDNSVVEVIGRWSIDAAIVYGI